MSGANGPVKTVRRTTESDFEGFVFCHPRVVNMESKARGGVKVVEEHIVILVLAVGQI